nr:DUF1772 domain-containing protein [Geodermatophilaceae bacterium]
VQATAYPAFADVAPDRWAAHHAAHARRISWAVGPAWAVQAGATAWWLVSQPGPLSTVHAVAAVAGVLVTAVWAVPAHQRMSDCFSPVVHRELLRANAVRAVVFTSAAVLATVGAA